MAKLFYTLEEAAQRLRKSTDEIMAMARSGQLQELKDKDQVLFRRSAIDQLAAEDDGGEINLESFDAGSSGSDIRLGGSSFSGDDLRLDEPPVAADGADDSMMHEPAAGGAGGAGGSAGISLEDSIGLADSGVKAVARPAGKASTSDATLGDSGDSMMLDAPGARKPGATGPGDSGAMDAGNTSLETVGSGSGLLDISSDESFFGAAMIEESMGGDGDGAAAIPGDAAEIFGGGDAAATEEAAPVTAGTTGVTFGTTALAEARDPAFSGFAAGAMLVAAVAMVALGWAVVETVVGGYSEVGAMITENWMIVLGGLAAGVLVAGGVGFGIGKATA
jgi:hypothetical protein